MTENHFNTSEFINQVFDTLGLELECQIAGAHAPFLNES